MKIFRARLLHALGAGLFVVPLLSVTTVHSKAAPKPVAPRQDSLSQEEVGRRAIQGILRELPIDSLRGYFEDGAHEALTAENLDGFRGQISWLPRFIGDTVEVFMTGTEVPDSAGRTAFFREYRFANEANRRAPLMIVHLYFVDSTTNKILGAYNKTFDDDTRNRLMDAQVWETPAAKIDVHSVSYAEIGGKLLPIVRVFDVDTAELDSTRAFRTGGIVAREAIARGVVDQVRKAKPGAPLMARFGVAFLRRDPQRGYLQVPIALFPKDYGGEEDTTAATEKPASSSKQGSNAKPAKKPAAAKSTKKAK